MAYLSKETIDEIKGDEHFAIFHIVNIINELGEDVKLLTKKVRNLAIQARGMQKSVNSLKEKVKK